MMLIFLVFALGIVSVALLIVKVRQRPYKSPNFLVQNDEVERWELFYEKTFDHFASRAAGSIEEKYLHGMSTEIADHYFEQYHRLIIWYPRSEKRYASFDLRDLDHPDTYDLIIEYFKKEVAADYGRYAMLLLGKNAEELKYYEKQRELFRNR